MVHSYTVTILCRWGFNLGNYANMLWLHIGYVPAQVMVYEVDPYHMIIKCFGTLLCCEWAYGFTLTLLQFCAGRGWFLGNLGDGPAKMIL
jgi:hypothetical protein